MKNQLHSNTHTHIKYIIYEARQHGTLVTFIVGNTNYFSLIRSRGNSEYLGRKRMWSQRVESMIAWNQRRNPSRSTPVGLSHPTSCMAYLLPNNSKRLQQTVSLLYSGEPHTIFIKTVFFSDLHIFCLNHRLHQYHFFFILYGVAQSYGLQTYVTLDF